MVDVFQQKTFESGEFQVAITKAMSGNSIACAGTMAFNNGSAGVLGITWGRREIKLGVAGRFGVRGRRSHRDFGGKRRRGNPQTKGFARRGGRSGVGASVFKRRG